MATFPRTTSHDQHHTAPPTSMLFICMYICIAVCLDFPTQILIGWLGVEFTLIALQKDARKYLPYGKKNSFEYEHKSIYVKNVISTLIKRICKVMLAAAIQFCRVQKFCKILHLNTGKCTNKLLAIIQQKMCVSE